MSEIRVRRARLEEARLIAAFVNLARPTARPVTEDEARRRLGTVGFLVAEQDGEMIGLLGWQVENLVARVTDFLVWPTTERLVAGRALIPAMEDAARQLLCEAAILFLPRNAPPELLRFWQAFGYELREVAALPRAWREVAREIRSVDEQVMLKQLREDMIRSPI